MARKRLIDPVEIGAKGGKARANRLSDEELSAASSVAANARWAAYYAAHPDKLKAKLEREARKGKVKRGRPPQKKANPPAAP
jgi:hypothetical protein